MSSFKLGGYGRTDLVAHKRGDYGYLAIFVSREGVMQRTALLSSFKLVDG